MKKFIVISVILMCLCLYGIIKLSMSESQNVNGAAETNQSTKSINAGNANKASPAEETQSAKQINAENTDKATPEEDSGTPATAEQVEAVTKVFNEFTNAIANEDYEQAWKLMAESIRSKHSLEEFKKAFADKRASIAKSTIRPGSATIIRGHLILVVTDPSGREDHEGFVQENGQWKLGD